MRKFFFSFLIALTLLSFVALTACDGADGGEATVTESQTPSTTAPAVTTQAPITTTQAPVTTARPKITLDAEMDGLYAEQGFHYPTTALYIYSTRPENRKTDANGNALCCRSSGALDFCFDGDYLWYFCTIYDTTMFDPDTEYVLTDKNPWQTDSVEVWYSFDGKKLLHVDVDAWGLRLFTDDTSRSVHFDEVVYRVKNDRDAGVWYAEIGIPAKNESGKPLQSGDTVYVALQINDLMTDFKQDDSRDDNLAFNGGHKINNFKKVVLP